LKWFDQIGLDEVLEMVYCIDEFQQIVQIDVIDLIEQWNIELLVLIILVQGGY
jgi:hypothetical protein